MIDFLLFVTYVISVLVVYAIFCRFFPHLVRDDEQFFRYVSTLWPFAIPIYGLIFGICKIKNHLPNLFDFVETLAFKKESSNEKKQ